ncbi:MAG: extracellular solute-binding protein [Treponema sp.]|nr:extracellular solute-binding protein [Treponema sp.]
MKITTKVAFTLTAAACLLAGTACSNKEAASSSGSSSSGSEPGSVQAVLNYKDIVLGTTGTDIKANISLMSHRTDMLDSGYSGTTWAKYIAEFNKSYPGITVNVEGITDYASVSLLRLQGGDWGDMMMIPAIDKKELENYFLPFGSLSEVSSVVRFADQWAYGDKVYGIPSTGNAQGVLYNKKVFKDAGITTLPKTPEEFIDCLKKIKASTKAIPLYTNYAAGWTMGAWDAYIGGSATGSADFMNNTLLHSKNPFADPGDGTGPYNVYKVLYEATRQGLIEADYTTTDWEGCKGMLNRGEIGTMVLGSWAYTQMQGAGPNPDDIGYMSFPITVKGKQYASAGPDYNFGINVKASDTNKMASMIFIKWMTEKSGFAYNEGGIPIAASDNKYPAVYAAFDGIDFVADNPAKSGEEDLKGKLDADSELNINNGGNDKIQAIIEHAFYKDKSFDDIMADWNKAWSDAQTRNGAN